MPRLLIVEDDDRIRLSLRLALEDEGYAVKDVPTAEEGLAEQRASPADVVLVDLMLPGMDGFDCIRALRRTGDLPPMGQGLSWNDIDYLYTLRSLQRRTGHRYEDSQAVLREIGAALAASLVELQPADDTGFGDLHTLFAGLCALAVVQESVPGLIRTDKPLRLVLERRPFL